MIRHRPSPRRRGFTIGELAICVAAGAALAAAAVPVLANIGGNSGEARSWSNLRILGEAHANYAETFSNRQFTAIPDDVGVVNGNCSTYINTIACPPPLLLGWSSNGAAWGYYLGSSGLCSPYGYPGGPCTSNWPVYKPIEFAGVSAGFGSFRLGNCHNFNSFVDGRFYSDVHFSPNDAAPYALGAKWRDQGKDFESDSSYIGFTSYCLSPAAMWSPEVLSSANGGYKDPNTFATSYASPAVTQCAYPDLKTRILEHNWNVGAPSYTFHGPDDSWVFNASAAVCPTAIFFDGHIARIANSKAIEDDATLFATSGQRLWSRATPFGPLGYRGDQALETERTSHTVLTMDGILGRDQLGTR